VIGSVDAAPAGAEAAAAEAAGTGPVGVDGCALAANAHAATGAAIQRAAACARRRRIERVCCRRAARPIRPLNPESHPRRATRGARRRRTQAAHADVNGAAKDDPRGADL
jgi:hypothetical protein